MDLLVRLYDIPDVAPYLAKLKEKGIMIRKPIGPERDSVYEWIKENFGTQWAAECMSGFYRDPKGLYIAVHIRKDDEGIGKPEMLGFAAYDATCKGFFGPTGVHESARNHGIGRALLLSCLHAMREEGYGYAIIGDTEKVDYYNKCCGATIIENSTPGVYGGCLIY